MCLCPECFLSTFKPGLDLKKRQFKVYLGVFPKVQNTVSLYSSSLIALIFFLQNASAQAISGTGALRIGAAFLVCVVLH